MTIEDDILALHMKKPHWPAWALAEKLGCSKECVRDVCRRVGVALPSLERIPQIRVLRSTIERARCYPGETLHEIIDRVFAQHSHQDASRQ